MYSTHRSSCLHVTKACEQTHAYVRLCRYRLMCVSFIHLAQKRTKPDRFFVDFLCSCASFSASTALTRKPRKTNEGVCYFTCDWYTDAWVLHYNFITHGLMVSIWGQLQEPASLWDRHGVGLWPSSALTGGGAARTVRPLYARTVRPADTNLATLKTQSDRWEFLVSQSSTPWALIYRYHARWKNTTLRTFSKLQEHPQNCSVLVLLCLQIYDGCFCGRRLRTWIHCLLLLFAWFFLISLVCLRNLSKPDSKKTRSCIYISHVPSISQLLIPIPPSVFLFSCILRD